MADRPKDGSRGVLVAGSPHSDHRGSRAAVTLTLGEQTDGEQRWRRARATLLLLAALCVGACGRNDASSGYFLGYRIGDRYPLPEPFFSLGTNPLNPVFVIVRADHPVKPDDIQEVAVYISLESHTIMCIEGRSTFKTHDEAAAFVRHYARTLAQKYPTWVPANAGILGERRIDYQDRLRLEVLTHEGYSLEKKKPDGSWVAYVKLIPTGEYEDELQGLAQDEADRTTLGLSSKPLLPGRDGL